MSNFNELQVIQATRNFVKDIYLITEQYPADERYGMTAQLRRAAVSIGANLAEGCGRSSRRELIRFADIASGSAHEVEFLLQVSNEVGLLHQEGWDGLHRQVTTIQRMLAGLKSSLRKTT